MAGLWVCRVSSMPSLTPDVQRTGSATPGSAAFNAARQGLGHETSNASGTGPDRPCRGTARAAPHPGNRRSLRAGRRTSTAVTSRPRRRGADEMDNRRDRVRTVKLAARSSNGQRTVCCVSASRFIRPSPAPVGPLLTYDACAMPEPPPGIPRSCRHLESDFAPRLGLRRPARWLAAEQRGRCAAGDCAMTSSSAPLGV
jgi:hypothetical protein